MQKITKWKGNNFQKSYKLKFSCNYVHLCLNYYKDSWNFVQQLERSCTENCSSSISKYGQTLEFKKGQNSPQNERLNEIPCQWWEGVAYLLAWVWGPPWPCPWVEPPVADSPSLTVGTRTEYTGCCWILSETSQVLVGSLWNKTSKNNDIALKKDHPQTFIWNFSSIVENHESKNDVILFCSARNDVSPYHPR